MSATSKLLRNLSKLSANQVRYLSSTKSAVTESKSQLSPFFNPSIWKKLPKVELHCHLGK
jgi:hypothetical protein